ncbi:hypothetical protein P9112_003473 [Eukaryota sp. TZLM1-RC]
MGFTLTSHIKPKPTQEHFDKHIAPLIPLVIDESCDVTFMVAGTSTSGRQNFLMADTDGIAHRLSSHLSSLCSDGTVIATLAVFSLPFRGNHVLDLLNNKAKVEEQDGEFEELIEGDLADPSFSFSSSLTVHDHLSTDCLTLRFNLARCDDTGDLVSGGSLSLVLLPPFSSATSAVYAILTFSLIASKGSDPPSWLHHSLLTRTLLPSFDPEAGHFSILLALDNQPLEHLLSGVDVTSRSAEQARKIEKELNQRLAMFEEAAHKEQVKMLEEFQKSKGVYEQRIKDLKDKLEKKQSDDYAAFQEKVGELEAKKGEFEAKKEEFEQKKAELEEAHNQTKQQLRKKSAQLQKVEEELARLKKRLESRNAEIKKKEKKIQKLETEVKNREEELMTQMNTLPSVPEVDDSVVGGINPEIETELAKARTDLHEERKKREDLEFIVMELRSKLDSKNWVDDDDIEQMKTKRNKRNPDTMERISRDDEEYDTSDYERINGHESTFDLSEKVLQYLQHGTLLIKHGRAGKPHLRYFYVNKERTRVCWRNVKNEKEADSTKGDHFIQLAEVTRFILGQHTEVFQRQAVINPDDDERSFSLVLKDGSRTLDVVCETEMEHEAWVLGLSSLLNVEPRWGQMLDLRPFPESRKLDGGEADLCEKYRIIPEEYLRVKELVLEECYERGYITKADIRIVCRIDILRASKIHEFMEGRRWICARPLYDDDDPLVSPYSDDEDGWM